MKPFVTLALFLLTVPVIAQVEHAPTVEQCRADQRLWLAKIENVGPDSNLPGYTTLVEWHDVMNDCRKIDPENKLKYYNTQAEVAEVQVILFTNFIRRHGLVDEFLAEDAAGKR